MYMYIYWHVFSCTFVTISGQTRTTYWWRRSWTDKNEERRIRDTSTTTSRTALTTQTEIRKTGVLYKVNNNCILFDALFVLLRTSSEQSSKLKNDHEKLSDEITRAELRYQELNEALEGIHNKIRDAKVHVDMFHW